MEIAIISVGLMLCYHFWHSSHAVVKLLSHHSSLLFLAIFDDEDMLMFVSIQLRRILCDYCILIVFINKQFL